MGMEQHNLNMDKPACAGTVKSLAAIFCLISATAFSQPIMRNWATTNANPDALRSIQTLGASRAAPAFGSGLATFFSLLGGHAASSVPASASQTFVTGGVLTNFSFGVAFLGTSTNLTALLYTNEVASSMTASGIGANAAVNISNTTASFFIPAYTRVSLCVTGNNPQPSGFNIWWSVEKLNQ